MEIRITEVLLYICMYGMHVCMYVCTYVYVCVCVYICMYVYMYGTNQPQFEHIYCVATRGEHAYVRIYDAQNFAIHMRMYNCAIRKCKS